jgi:hypothetical protein
MTSAPPSSGLDLRVLSAAAPREALEVLLRRGRRAAFAHINTSSSESENADVEEAQRGHLDFRALRTPGTEAETQRKKGKKGKRKGNKNTTPSLSPAFRLGSCDGSSAASLGATRIVCGVVAECGFAPQELANNDSSVLDDQEQDNNSSTTNAALFDASAASAQQQREVVVRADEGERRPTGGVGAFSFISFRSPLLSFLVLCVLPFSSSFQMISCLSDTSHSPPPTHSPLSTLHSPLPTLHSPLPTIHSLPQSWR